MATFDFKYCKLGSLNDINFNLTYIKQNEVESFKSLVCGECFKSKDRILSHYNKSKKEYLLRLKLQKEISELSQQQATASQKHTQLLKKLQNFKEERESKDKRKELKKVSLYENNLGLKIEPASNLTVSKDEIAVSFIFKNIDERKPEETYSFNLVITKNGIYKAVDCHPKIMELDELVEKLNKSNNLHNFIVNIRKKFCECLSK